jgi:hypothetical protein
MEQPHSQDLSNSIPEKPTIGPSRCSLVRFSIEQFEKIKRDGITFGQSTPELLRRAYFQRKTITPYFAEADAHRIMVAINRVSASLHRSIYQNSNKIRRLGERLAH